VGFFAVHKSFWLLPLLSVASVAVPGADQETSSTFRELALDGHARTYRVHVPQNLSTPAPLVVALHGSSAGPEQFEKSSGFSRLAEEQGFIVAYPQALRGDWNDDVLDENQPDDVAFVRAMVADIAEQYDVDKKRVFATGVGDGGTMTAALGTQAADLFSAIAPVVAELPATEQLKLAQPVSVLIIHGTADPVVPNRSTEIAVQQWCAANGISAENSAAEMMPDVDRADGCRVNRIAHSGGKWGTEVVLLQVEGGGHTWPGVARAAARQGPVCRDIQASREIWSFFAEHPRNVPKNSKSRKSPQRVVQAF
jgi:polyhydroxybutyrate depolymerase